VALWAVGVQIPPPTLPLTWTNQLRRNGPTEVPMDAFPQYSPMRAGGAAPNDRDSVGLIVAVSTVGGVWLTQMYDLRRARDERVDREAASRREGER
jgi:hypothetical protein